MFWNHQSIHVGDIPIFSLLGKAIGFVVLGQIDLEHHDGTGCTIGVRYNIIEHNGEIIADRLITPLNADLADYPDPNLEAANLWHKTQDGTDFPVQIEDGYVSKLITSLR